jgi:pimeloyl-ACP methyl ester carboxylesterase
MRRKLTDPRSTAENALVAVCSSPEKDPALSVSYRRIRVKQLILGGWVAAMCLTPGLNAQTEPPYPAPGRMVDIGGWKIHLNCTGQAKPSQPTIILEAGAGDFSVEWSLVQPRVAEFARVCSYDRAGDGWSEMGPYPRTMRQLVYELHALLETAAEKGPFLLIAQSFGGVVARLYQSTYPDDVAGMMLIDAGRLDPWRYLNGSFVRLNETATGRPILPVKTDSPLREGDIPAEARRQMEAGARSLVPRANESREKLPDDAKRMRVWALGTVKHAAAYVNPFEAEELALMIAAIKDKEYPLGNLPLIVITAGRAQYEDAQMQQDHTRSQAAMAKLSRNGKQIVATESGHHVHIDQPQLVTDAIRDLLAASTKPR